MTMNYRNPVFTANGTIDCEVEHPVYGWIPFTASENDVEQHGRDVFAAAQATAAPYVAPPPPDPAPLTKADVDAERDRRILEGSTFNLSGYANTIRLAGDSVTRNNLADVAVMAQLKVGLGQGSDTLVWRDEDNVNHTITFIQLVELFNLGFTFFNSVWVAAWPLKDADPIPSDYESDQYWP